MNICIHTLFTCIKGHYYISQSSHVSSDTACSRGFARMKGVICEGENM